MNIKVCTNKDGQKVIETGKIFKNKSDDAKDRDFRNSILVINNTGKDGILGNHYEGMKQKSPNSTRHRGRIRRNQEDDAPPNADADAKEEEDNTPGSVPQTEAKAEVKEDTTPGSQPQTEAKGPEVK